MNAKHTPGPWAVEQGEGPHSGRTVITARQAGMTARSPLAHLSNLLGADEPAADARLIAAAPDLLAAAKKVMAGLDARIEAAPSTAKPVFNGIADLHDAINKAEVQS